MFEPHKIRPVNRIDGMNNNDEHSVAPDVCQGKPTICFRSKKNAAIIEKIKYLLPRQFQITFLGIAFLLLLYALLRLGFLVYNHHIFAESTVGEIMLTFIYGLRFDLSGILMLNFVFLFLYNLPGYPARNRRFGAILFGFFCVINLIGIVLSLADYAYYPTIYRRMTYEPLVMPREIWDSLPGLSAEHWQLLVTAILVCTGFVWSSARMLSFFESGVPYRPRIFREALFLVLLITLMIFGIRGGLQSQPIRQSHAFIFTNPELGYATLNTPFNIILSANQKTLTGLKFMPSRKARLIVQKMLYKPGEYNLSPQYPFLRQSQPSGAKQHPNVVIFIMESWNADDVGALGANPSPTPYFDRLAADGWLFTNFMANGQRSMEILPAIVGSIPNLFDAPLINSRSELDRFLGMGTIFSRNGYTTSFHHGATTGSMGFDTYSHLAGFKYYYGMEDFPDLKDSDWDGNWGVFDHIFYGDVIKRLDGFQHPFLSVIYSLSPHEPMTIPPDLESQFAPFAKESRYRQALRYSDYSLGRFFEQASSHSWFSNTVFLIVGDHTYRPTQKNFRAAFRVPLLIYAPGRIAAKRIDRLGSQIDILPMCIEKFLPSAPHASMGKSPLNPSMESWTIVKYGKQYGFINDHYLFLSNMEGNEGLYLYQRDPRLAEDLKEKLPSLAGQYRLQLMAYVQEVTMAIEQNRIYKEKD